MAKGKKHGKSGTAAGGTLVTFLLDRTGSMQSIRNDTIGAFNAYLESLRKEAADIEFSFLQFDSISIDKICVNMPIAEVKPLTVETYQPRASTPLIDAAYKTIEAVGVAVERRAVKPKVVICIQTDGEENSSTEHSWAELNLIIKEKSKLGWQFNFMGAGIDAYVQGERMGIARAATVSYDRKSPAAAHAAFAASADNTRRFAVGAAPSVEYTPAQKAAAGDRFDVTRPVKTVLSRAKAIIDKVSL
jgi:hypothetical protein